jgi:hypothetical protein
LQTINADREPRYLSNAKAKQLEDDRIREIEYANRKLFRRMHDIELKPIPEHLSPFLEDEGPSQVLVARISRKRVKLQTIEQEN